MTAPTSLDRVRAILDEALEVDLADRDEFITASAGGDRDVEREVRSLLAAYERAGHLFDTSPHIGLTGFEPEALVEEVGSRIGPYRILGVVGCGGMGAVYEAERADGLFEKRVAVKLLGRGLSHDSLVARFEKERRILARLDHPNVARLFDGGVTGEGHPYFVMELVAGAPIDAYCDREDLTVRERLDLFRRVCAAVDYAHRNLVVHRDLKPSNILVTERGEPKLLDFGVATILDPETTDGDTPITVPGLMTPAYASPEQIRGEPVNTLTDVYSLGVILYELLTRRHPQDASDSTPLMLASKILEDDPPRPSDVVAKWSASDVIGPGPARGASRRTLRGDLDNIVLKALRKKPERRYGSVDQLADDLRLHSEGLPVRARRSTATYRLGKFARRHWPSVVSAFLLLILLVSGALSTRYQAQRAETALNLAEGRLEAVRVLTQTLLFDVHDAIADLPGATEARERIVRRGAEYLDRLRIEAERDPDLARVVAEGYVRLGGIQGIPTDANLGRVTRAERSFERALELAASAVERAPGDLAARRTLALAHEGLGEARAWRGDVEAGVAHATSALELHRSIFQAVPDSLARSSLVVSHVKLGDLLGNPNFPNLNRQAEALDHYRRALTLLEAAPPEARETASMRRSLGWLHERMGTMLAADGRVPEARDRYVASLAIRRRLAEDGDATLDALRDLPIAHQRLCEVDLRSGALDRALEECRRAVEEYRELHAADPENALATRDLANGRFALHQVLAAHGEWHPALEEIEASNRLFGEVLALDAGNVPIRRRLIRGRLDESRIRLRLAAAGESDEGGRARRARDHARRLVAELEDRGIDPEPEATLLQTVERELARLDSPVNSGRAP